MFDAEDLAKRVMQLEMTVTGLQQLVPRIEKRLEDISEERTQALKPLEHGIDQLTTSVADLKTDIRNLFAKNQALEDAGRQRQIQELQDQLEEAREKRFVPWVKEYAGPVLAVMVSLVGMGAALVKAIEFFSKHWK